MVSGLVMALRAAGVDVLTTAEADRRGHDDASQLEFATVEGRTIVTSNIGDFARLHAAWTGTGRVHAGMVLVPQRTFGIGELSRRLVNLVTAFEPSEMAGRAEYVTSWG